MRFERLVPLAVILSASTLIGSSAGAQTSIRSAHNVWGPAVFTEMPDAFVAHGVAGDTRVAFVNEALPNPQVRVVDRLTRRQIGTLPAPDGGFHTPMNIRLRSFEPTHHGGTRGEIVMLDSARPDQAGTMPAFLRVFRYEYQPHHELHAELVMSHALPMNTNPMDQLPNGLIYPGGFELLPNGDVVVVDLMALWISDATMEHWTLGLISSEFAFGPYCSTVTSNGQEVPGFYMAVRDPSWQKVRKPYQMRMEGVGPLLPPLKGITYVASADRVAFQRVATPGGIFWIDRATLFDRNTPAYAKAFDYLVRPEIGLADLSGDVAFDRYHPDSEWVYWQRTSSEPGQNTCAGAHPYSEKWSPLYRVNVRTGVVEFVAESWRLYDFPTVLSVLPPQNHDDRFTTILSSNVREEWIHETNNLVSETTLFGPTIVPMVRVDANSR